MGRPGSRSSGSRSGGGHSSSRSSGGHRASSSRPSSSSRPRSSSNYGYRGSSFGSGPSHWGSPPPPRPHRHPFVYFGPTPPEYGHRYRTRRPSSARIMLTVGFTFIILFLLLSPYIGNNSAPVNTKNREKVNTGVAYKNDCIIDELGWIDNKSRTSKELQNFYNETGIQPYVVLLDYDKELLTDDDKIDYAENWYEENIDNEGTFLYMYFAEEDTDNDLGYMCYVNGKQITSVMDSEAIKIFWNYLDNNWFKDISMDDVIVNTFNSTAKTIMTRTTTKTDILNKAMIVVVVIAVSGSIIIIMKRKRKNEAEKAAETERILNTPLNNNEDDLVNKYE